MNFTHDNQKNLGLPLMSNGLSNETKNINYFSIQVTIIAGLSLVMIFCLNALLYLVVMQFRHYDQHNNCTMEQ